MTNKYLEKISSVSDYAKLGKEFGKDFAKGWKRSSTTSKVGLGMSAVGLGMSGANYHNSIANRKDNKERAKLETKSLEILQDIAKGVQKPTKVVVKVDAQPNAIAKKALASK